MTWREVLQRSVKARITLLTLAVFLVSLGALMWFASRLLREDMQQQISDQQLASVHVIAEQLNQQLIDRFMALQNLSVSIGPKTLASPHALQALLEQQPHVRGLFNFGIFVVAPDGRVLARAPLQQQDVGTDLADRDYVRAALHEGRWSVGRPVVGRMSKVPVISMSTPILDAAGTPIGALAGSISLGEHSFLDKISENRYGHTGQYYLLSPRHQVIVTSSDKRRIMADLSAAAPPGWSQMLSFQEGHWVYVDAKGDETLGASARVPVAGWVVHTAVSTAEAFASIRDMQHRVWLATALMAVLAAGAVWWMLRVQLRPLQSAARTLSTFSADVSAMPPLPVSYPDEIGELIASFNRMLGLLAERQQALQESEFRWKFAIEGSGDGLWDWNIAEEAVFYSERWKTMLGDAPEDIGNRHEEWTRRIHPDDLACVMTDLRSHLDARAPVFQSEYRLRCKDGQYKWVLDRGLVISRDAAGQPLRMIGVHTDITDRKQVEERIRNLAYHDTLTQLPNRRLLNDRLGMALAHSQRNRAYGAVMMLDLDNFKPLNDEHGHATGDLLLVEVARRLRHCVRETDTVARVGGDEFVVLLSRLDEDGELALEQALHMAAQVQKSLGQPYRLMVSQHGLSPSWVEHVCSCSIGVVMFCGHHLDGHELLKRADIAMYQAKAAGRNAIRVASTPEAVV